MNKIRDVRSMFSHDLLIPIYRCRKDLWWVKRLAKNFSNKSNVHNHHRNLQRKVLQCSNWRIDRHIFIWKLIRKARIAGFFLSKRGTRFCSCFILLLKRRNVKLVDNIWLSQHLLDDDKRKYLFLDFSFSYHLLWLWEYIKQIY